MMLNSSRASLCLVAVTLFILAACERTPDAPVLQELPSPAGENSFAPRLAADADGVYLSWLKALGDGQHALKFSRLDGNEWSEPRTVITGDNWFANWADTPGVRPVGDYLFAHWLVRSGPGTYHYNIHAAWSKDEGDSWSEPFILHREGRQAEHGFLSSVVLENGDLAVAWLDGRHTVTEGNTEAAGHGHHGDMSLRWARFEPGASIPGEDEEVDDRVCDCCMTAMVLEPEGPRVFYRDRSHDEIRDIASIGPLGESIQRSETVKDDGWRIAACPVNGPAALRRPGKTAVAWFSGVVEPRVQLRYRHDDSGHYSEALRIDDGGAMGRVALAALDETSLLVFWMAQRNGEAHLMGRVVDGERLSPATPLRTVAASRASGVPVALAHEGRVLLAWTGMGENRRRVMLGVVKPESQAQDAVPEHE